MKLRLRRKKRVGFEAVDANINPFIRNFARMNKNSFDFWMKLWATFCLLVGVGSLAFAIWVVLKVLTHYEIIEGIL